MRRAIILISVLLLSVCASARIVTPEQAKSVAEAFFASAGTRSSSSSVRLVWTDGGPATRSSASQPAFYVFNRDGGGFVIVSAESATDSVLGYSYSNSFDPSDIPAGLRDWMGDLSSHIRRAAATGVSGSVRTRAGAGAEIETALWAQTSPFNDQCPEYALAGCGAVAMGIVLRAMQWPDAGVGDLETYSYEDVHAQTHVVEGYSLGEPYDWESMPLRGVNKDNSAAIARLLRDCGVMIKSRFSYTDNGTLSYVQDIVPALKAHMKYDGAAIMRYYQFADTYEWLEAIRSELDAGRPVLYTGGNEAGEGHAFVVDGYDGEGLLRINWGWGGNSNGYFEFPMLGEFVYGHSAVIGLRKDEGGSPQDYMALEYIKSAATSFATGAPFDVDFSFTNLSDVVFDGSVAVARLSDDGEVCEIVSAEIPVEGLAPLADKAQEGVSCTIGGAIEIGDVLSVVYKREGADWCSMVYDYENPGASFIFISDAIHLDKATSFSYDKPTRTVTLTTKEGTQCSVSPDVEIDSPADGKFRLSGFSAGKYTVTLKCGKESFTFDIVL